MKFRSLILTHSIVAMTIILVSTCVTLGQATKSSTEKVAPPPAKSNLTKEQKQATIDALVQAIDNVYLYQDKVNEVTGEIRKHQQAGDYDAITSHYEFAVQLSQDLRGFTNDLHFAVRHGGNGNRFGAIRLGAPGGNAATSGNNQPTGNAQQIRIGGPNGGNLSPDSPMFKMLHEQFRKNNFSMPRLEVLPGNVGYMRLDMMPPLDVARPTLDAAMMFLSNTDAMIIDVRDTPGGVGGFIPYLMSYFFPEGGKLLFTRYFGADDRSDRFKTADKVGGKRRPDVPLYILTSSNTGSAAENLAFTLKNHGRAITVGETTRGGGHSATMVTLGNGFSATIPIADVRHGATGESFDGVGCTPSVKIAADEGLEKAHEMALNKLMETANDLDKTSLNEALAELKAAREMKKDGAPDASQFEVYVGQYGVRKVFVEGGKLKYQRQGGPAIALTPLGDDTFRMRTPPGVRSALALPHVRFERDDENNVKGFSLVRDGQVESYVGKQKNE